MRIPGLVLILSLTWIPPLWAGDSVEDIFCSDYHGYQVFWIKNRTINKIAATGRTKESIPIIRYNPELLPGLSPQTRTFALQRECANHVLGYTLEKIKKFGALSDGIEKADCWAISRMFYANGLSVEELQAIEKEINTLSKDQWAHFPGPPRVINFASSCPLK